MSTFYIKQNDTSPVIQRTLTDAAGVGVDLSGDTAVAFHMVSKADGTTKINALATIVTAATGIVKYTWLAADTNTVGSFWAEWQVIYSSGAIETFPNDGHDTIEITDDLI